MPYLIRMVDHERAQIQFSDGPYDNEADGSAVLNEPFGAFQGRLVWLTQPRTDVP